MSLSPDELFCAIAGLAARTMSRPAEVLAELEPLLAAAPPLDARLAAQAARVRGLARVYTGDLGGHEELQAALGAAEAAGLAPRQRYDLGRALSMATVQMGLLDQALDWGHRALALARESGEPAAIAEGLLACGVALSRSGQARPGLEFYEQALPLFLEQREWRNALAVLNNLGINHKNLGRPAQALESYERALALAETHPELAELADVLRTNLSEPLLQLGRLAEARRVGELALLRMVDKGHRPGELAARIGLARVLLEAGEPEDAQAHLEAAATLAEQLGDRVQGVRAHQQLWTLHKAAGRFREALLHLEATHEGERALFNEDSDRRLRALQAQAEVAAARIDASQQRLRGLELERAHTELRQLNERLQAADREKSRLLARLGEESRTDALTGLANRRRFDERLAEEAERLARLREDGKLSLALLDVDHFKQVNDRFGHPVGDAVLRQLGALLAVRVRGADFVARLGGEEFCVLCFGLSDAEAAQAAEAWRAAVAAHDWRALHPELDLTVSIGLAQWREAPDARELMALADARLYAAKRAGRDRVVVSA